MQYFIQGDYDKAVSHCRSALESIPKALPIDVSGLEEGDRLKFKPRLKTFLSQHLSDFLTESKRDNFVAIITGLWNMTSISHHPPSPGYFNRADAESIMLITTASLAYVGKLLKQKEVLPCGGITALY